MRVTIIYAHPNPKSFNNAILEATIRVLKERNVDYRVIDLYKDFKKVVLDGEDFEILQQGKNPEDVIKFQEDILWATKLIFIYPVWWWQFPAILKGFVDRVFSYGFAYSTDEKGIVPLLKQEKALVFMTTGGPREEYEGSVRLDVLRLPISEGVMGFCGVKECETHIYSVPTVSDEVRKGYLKEVEEAVKKF
jgi:NAD(P)H dehydrogenase (quinone)